MGNFGPTVSILSPFLEQFDRLGLHHDFFLTDFGAILGPFWMNVGIILEPFCISNESIYQIGRFIHSVSRLLRLPYTDRYIRLVVEFPCRRTEFGTKSSHLFFVQNRKMLGDCGGSDVSVVPNPIP